MVKIVENITKTPFEKHYVYSSYYRNFSRDGKQKWDHGIFALGNILTLNHTYEYIPVAECRRIY